MVHITLYNDMTS